MNPVFDIAIVGSGFAGSLLSMIAHRLGRSVILLEKTRHPRFTIGESSTPLANLLLEELTTKYDLPRLRPLVKWGSWQQTYPEIGCGLKRGFTFYHHNLGMPFSADTDRSNQLVVAASPHDGVSDTHWYRPDFDHFFVREAQRTGIEYVDEAQLEGVTHSGDEVRIDGTRHNRKLSVRCRFLIDATGPRGFLHRALNLSDAGLPNFPATQALFTHFADVRRLSDMPIEPGCHAAPFPVDAAAVHHVFDGGWIWVLRFNNGLTSAGVAAKDAFADKMIFREGAPAWRRLMQLLPTVGEQFAEAKEQLEFIHSRRLSFLSSTITGERWSMLPSAAGFVDPLLSTGFPLTLLGVGRLAEILERNWETDEFQPRLKEYAIRTRNDLLAASRLVAGLYASMNDFEMFSSLSKLYFAAVVYSEAVRRLERPHLAGSFLMHEHAAFGPKLRDISERAVRPMSPIERRSLIDEIDRAIEPFDVAGLSDHQRKNWYPVIAEDLLGNASKVGADRSEIEKMLERSGFWRQHEVEVN